MSATERGYVNITEAAALLGVSRVTIWRWIRAGRLPASRLGHRTTRIKRADLDRLIERARPVADQPSALRTPPASARGAMSPVLPAERETAVPEMGREAAAARRLRDEFRSLAAQEAETPFAGLSPDAELVLRRLTEDGQIEPEEVVQALQAVAGQTETLARLLDQLLSVAPVGGVEPASEGWWYGDQRAITPHERDEIPEPTMRLRQVLTGLLDNAIKYGPDGSPIDVVVSLAAPEVVELSVPDRGLELSPGQRIQNLERFYRDHGDSRKSGFGLGQFISRQIVDLHGGEIRAEFPPDGVARFVVRLPLGTEAQAAPAGRSVVGDE